MQAINPSPIVSVLMPAYNHCQFVAAAVQSVLDQTFVDLELIVIDDNSTDSTWSVLQEFDDPRIRLYRHEVNLGAHATLNEAMCLAQGKYLSLINSDDMYHPYRIERLVAEAMERDVFIYTDVSFIDARGGSAQNHPRALGYDALRNLCSPLPSGLRLLAGNLTITTSNLFYARSFAKLVGDFSPLRYTHDWEWVLRAELECTPIWLREALIYYRVHDSNTLSEDDGWRHIHENSFVQAKAMLTLRQRLGKEGSSCGAREASLALLQNESFHPLAMCLYLTWMLGGVPDGTLQDMTCRNDGNWILKELAQATACPETLFGSLEKLADREQVIASQKELVEERWDVIQRMNNQIAERDACITSQAALVDQRWQTIQEMSMEIARRDEVIAAQKSLIEDRWSAMEAMRSEIAGRDEAMAELRHSLHALQGAFDELAADWLVKIALRIRRFFKVLSR